MIVFNSGGIRTPTIYLCPMQIFSIPPSMVPDLHEKTSPLAKYLKSGLTKLEALYRWGGLSPCEYIVNSH